MIFRLSDKWTFDVLYGICELSVDFSFFTVFKYSKSDCKALPFGIFLAFCELCAQAFRSELFFLLYYILSLSRKNANRSSEIIQIY